MRRSLALLVPVLFLLPRCGCAPPGNPEGSPCETAQDCQGDLVCDPDAEACAELTCETHLECSAGAMCDDGDCVDNVAGGPCDEDVNCVDGQTCRSGACFTVGSEGAPCTTAEECQDPLICEPNDDVCAEDVDCVAHSDCGDAAFCDEATETCEPAEPAGQCENDDQCVSTERCVGVVCIPEECEGEAFEATPSPVNVMIVFDRSGSMEDELGNEGSKWDVGRAAVETLMATTPPAVRFGLMVYPGQDPSCNDGDFCEAGNIPIDIGDANREDIVEYLTDSDTCQLGTPTAETLAALPDVESLQDTTRPNYVLLITDGQSTCDNPTPRVEDLFDATPQVKTFVVGFGDGVDPDELEDMAEAGGTARQGNPAYYQADNAASLEQALADIVGAVLGCDYTLDLQGEDPDLLIVYFNGQSVPRDTTGQSGWDVDVAANRLSFAGNACVALQSGIVTDLTLVYGCPQIVEPPPPDAGIPDDDAGPGPDEDAGNPGGGCNDLCDNGCGTEACLIPPGDDEGECGPCGDDGDCCPGSLCLPSGACILIGG